MFLLADDILSNTKITTLKKGNGKTDDTTASEKVVAVAAVVVENIVRVTLDKTAFIHGYFAGCRWMINTLGVKEPHKNEENRQR